MKKAIYAGSFDPITNGHIDIVNRAKGLFDEIIIAVIENPDKNALFYPQERIVLIKEVFKNDPKIKVEGFIGLLVDYVQRKKIFTIIRGLRAVTEFDYEFQMALMNRQMEPNTDTLFFMTDAKYSYLSSSLVKQLAQYKGNISEFVPKCVQKSLEVKYK